jgi:DNA polymerase-3 subunit beta
MVKAEGPDVEIAFNHAFLVDGLSSAGSDTLRLEIESALKPGLIKSGSEEGFLYVLMPVRLG